ncbi:glucosaminidase domain-containing protein [Lysobacter sp. HA35]
MTNDRLTPQQQFIADLYPAAVRVSRETGMSWELILAQAAQETGWGTKVLPGTHNIFNIKASSDWHGPTRTFNVWEIENGHKVWKDQAFRVYGSTEEALRDRVAFLRGNPRYAAAGLFDTGTKGDLHAEAAALQRGKYATDPGYATNLGRVFDGPTMQRAIAYARTHDAVVPVLHTNDTVATAPSADQRPVQNTTDRDRASRATIYEAARHHFLADDRRFEYGRSDMRLANKEGNLRTDPSRTEQDLDGDGLKGVDCSSFVWRGLREAGYGVPASPFTSHDLFNGRAMTPYARQHFDIISAAEAREPHGALQSGDVLLFKSNSGSGQHVAIFKGYDAHGRIQFIGSQTGFGPAEVTIAPHGYWDGDQQHIVGALRAKPEFRSRAPAHDIGATTRDVEVGPVHASAHAAATVEHARPRPALDGVQPGAHGPTVATLQRRLFELGYGGEDGKPLGIDGEFGRNTSHALKQFQREHGLQAWVSRGRAPKRRSIARRRR